MATPLLFLPLFKATVTKGCVSESTVSSDPTHTYVSDRMCYVSPIAAGSKRDVARIRREIRSQKDVRDAKIEIRAQSEACLCYGYTAEEDPMTRYQRVLREAETAEA